MKDSLIVNEIFGSIDGEGIRTGELATFIRLAGCNLRCSYCDTSYALQMTQGNKMTIDEIVERANEIGYRNITLTGGEPLLQKNSLKLIEALIENGFLVNIETNGSMDITPLLDKNVIITLDYKTLASGVNDKMLLSNLDKLRAIDVLKFVCDRNDFEDIKRVLKEHEIKSYVYFSPIFKAIQPYELVDFLKELHNEGFNTNKVRVQVQLHKVIWDPNLRGV